MNHLETRPTLPSSVALVADDELLVRMETGSLLEDAGYTVIEAANAADALTIFRSNDGIVLLVTDVDMPGAMDGLGLAAAVAHGWPETDIVVISGLVRPEPDAMPDGASFLGKPLNPRLILLKARELAQARAARPH
jgi:CheY-like chemotaxis protein